MKYGRWWAFQRSTGFSVGVHIEFRRRRTNSGIPFGPYFDLHLPPSFILSIGVNPIYAGDMDLIASYSRGGLNANSY